MLLCLAASSAAVWNPIQGLREFSRSVEFDFTEWTVQALFQKGVSAALRAEKFLSPTQQNSLIRTYLEQVYTSAVWNARLDQAVSQPNLVDRKVKITVARDGICAKPGKAGGSLPADGSGGSILHRKHPD